MWQSIKSLVQKLFLLIMFLSCILGAWYIARDEVSQDFATMDAAIFANDAISYIEETAAPFVRSRPISALVTSIAPPDYNTLITPIKPSQIAGLIHSRKSAEKNKSSMLVFLYELDCIKCDRMFNDINEYAAKKGSNTAPSVLAVAITDSKLELIKYLNTKKRGVMFKPLIIAPEHAHELTAYMKKINPNYQTVPHISLIKKGGKIKNYMQYIYVKGDFSKWISQ